MVAHTSSWNSTLHAALWQPRGLARAFADWVQEEAFVVTAGTAASLSFLAFALALASPRRS